MLRSKSYTRRSKRVSSPIACLICLSLYTQLPSTTCLNSHSVPPPHCLSIQTYLPSTVCLYTHIFHQLFVSIHTSSFNCLSLNTYLPSTVCSILTYSINCLSLYTQLPPTVFLYTHIFLQELYCNRLKRHSHCYIPNLKEKKKNLCTTTLQILTFDRQLYGGKMVKIISVRFSIYATLEMVAAAKMLFIDQCTGNKTALLHQMRNLDLCKQNVKEEVVYVNKI